MHKKMKKNCKICESVGRYRTSSMCYTCLQKHNKERAREKTICARCYNPKEPSIRSYCSECYKNINSKVKYRQMDADFMIDLYYFIKNLNVDELSAIDALVIAHYWSEIILYPHLYYSKPNSEQIELMIDDLNEFLKGKKIKK